MYLPQLAWAAVALRSTTTKTLFPPWVASEWMSQDDSVREGGVSFSTLDVLAANSLENPLNEGVVKFHGHLNFTAFGYGFASQRTVDAWPEVDLSAFDQLLVEIPYTDGKKYTINLKDTVPPVGRNDLDTLSWSYDFQLPATAQGAEIEQLAVPFKDLIPTYNGRLVNNSVPLNSTGIKRISIMIRR